MIRNYLLLELMIILHRHACVSNPTGPPHRYQAVLVAMSKMKLDEACRRLRTNDPTLIKLEYVSARGLMRGGLYSWGWDGLAL